MLAPFGVRSFRFQWPADLATSVAVEMEIVVLGWYVLAETRSVLLLAAFASLPYLGTLVAPAFGVVGDRVGHRNLIVAMRSLYCTLALLLFGLIASGVATPWHAFAIAAMAGLVRPSDQGLRNVLISESMPPDRLMAAIGLARTTADSARIIGPVTGAALVGWYGMGAAYAMVVALYATSVLLSLGIVQRRMSVPVGRVSPVRELRAAASMVWETPPQMAAMTLAFLINLAFYPFLLGLLPYVAKEVYGRDQTALGWLSASAAMGCVIASLLVSRIGPAILPGRSILLSAAAWATLTVVLGFTTGMAGGMLVLMLAGMAQSFCVVPMSVLQLRNAPAALRGRVMGLRTLAVYGLPIGLWIAGPLIAGIGFTGTALLYGGGGLVGVGLIALRWRRHLWPADVPANAAQEAAPRR
jgi:MFS family permease